ncbi:MAG: phosphonopyruvate decarboxylase [Coriobacteriales bacterium]|jgi:phosphonopyruvate decarboxylase
MQVETLVDVLGADFFVGVPDSQLKALCNYLINTYGTDPQHHVIAANEGNCTGIAAGYHLATGKSPVVYMQNSGEGNIINPVASLLSDKCYGIPVIFVIGWRGEPGVHDEPQHIYQGAVTVELLDVMDIASFVIGPETTEDELRAAMDGFREILAQGKSVAFVVRKKALEYQGKVTYRNDYTLRREQVIERVVQFTGDNPIVSTTGKTSRELFEIREAAGDGHGRDFLTVGSMGHSSSIALGVALKKPDATVWCIDGDGAALMHMGSLGLLGSLKPANFVHILVNNEAHESVGGQPTAAHAFSFAEIASACGYPYTATVDNLEDLGSELAAARDRGQLSLIEVKCAIGARDDLGRPTTTAQENKRAFMDHLDEL